MSAENDGGPTGTPVDPPSRTGERHAVGLLVVLVLVTVGWFLLSTVVAHNDARSAVRQTVGAGLGVTVLISAIGALRNSGRARRSDE